MATERLQIIIDALYEAGDELKRMRNDMEGVNESQQTNTRRTASMRDSFRSLTITMAAVTGAAYTLKKAWDFAEQGAQIERLEQSGQRLADRTNQSMTGIVNSIQSASGHTIDSMSAMQSANAAMALGVASTPAEFEKLTKAAVALGRAQGQNALQSINDLTTGVGRQSKLILDNLGITYDANQLYSEYAGSIGKTAEALTDAEKKQALLNVALEAAKPLLDENGDLIEDQAAQYEKISAAWTDYTAHLKKQGMRVVGPAIKQAGNMLTAYKSLDIALDRGIISQEEYARMTRRVKFHLMDQDDVTDRLTERQHELSAGTAVANKRLEDQTYALEADKKEMLETTIPAEILERKMEGLAGNTKEFNRQLDINIDRLTGLPEKLQLSVDALRNDWVPAWAEARTGPEETLRTLELMQARMESIARMRFAPIQIPVNVTGNGADLMLGGKLFGGGQGGQFGGGITFDPQGTNTLTGSEDALADKLLGRFGDLQ